MASVIQAILIIAALSALNSGLFASGRIMRSLGMANEAPKFTMKISKSGVPWTGIAMTAAVYAIGVWLNAAFPGQAFETALGLGSLTVIYVWIAIFACQLRLRSQVKRGLAKPSSHQTPWSPRTAASAAFSFFSWYWQGLPSLDGRAPLSSAQDGLHRGDLRPTSLRRGSLPRVALGPRKSRQLG